MSATEERWGRTLKGRLQEKAGSAGLRRHAIRISFVHPHSPRLPTIYRQLHHHHEGPHPARDGLSTCRPSTGPPDSTGRAARLYPAARLVSRLETLFTTDTLGRKDLASETWARRSMALRAASSSRQCAIPWRGTFKERIWNRDISGQRPDGHHTLHAVLYSAQAMRQTTYLIPLSPVPVCFCLLCKGGVAC